MSGSWEREQGEERSVEWCSGMLAQLEEPQRLCLWHASSLSQLRSLVEDGVMCPGMGAPRAQGKVVLGISRDSYQCLWPTRGNLELEGGDEFVKHNRVESKKGGVGAHSAAPLEAQVDF